MAISNEPCPYDRADRAGRCTSCVTANDSLTPCVVAWLGSRVGATNNYPVRMMDVETVSRLARTAA
jgi:hypothetical protein